MLTPNKHTNIKYSVIYIAGMLVLFLKSENIIDYEALKEKAIYEIGIPAKENLNNALTFLFALGKIEYIKEIDAIKLIR